MHKYLTTLGALKWPGTNVDLIEMLLQPAFPLKYLGIKVRVCNILHMKCHFFESRFCSRVNTLSLWLMGIKVTKLNRIIVKHVYSYLVTLVAVERFSTQLLILCFLFATHLMAGTRELKLKKTCFSFPNLTVVQSRRNIVLFPIRRPRLFVSSKCCHLATRSTTNFIEIN